MEGKIMSQDKVKLPAKRRKWWPWVLVVLLAALVTAVAVIPPRRQVPGANIRQATLERGSLTVTVIGTGQLGYDESSEIEVPAGLLVDHIYFDAGDQAARGDLMATFDSLSIRLAIDRVLSEIDNLDLAIARTPADTRVVRSVQAGRVKAIYIDKNDEAATAYEKHGAALLLSLDGRMAVTFESPAELERDDKLEILLSDGRSREGTVEKRDRGVYSVTLTDDGPEPGERVTVRTKEGEELGQGDLYVHRPLAIIATEGKVKQIHVSNNQKISAGKALFTLEDLPAGPAYDQLFADREEWEKKLRELLELEKTGELRAPFDLFVLDTRLKEGEKTGEKADMANRLQEAESVFPAFTVAPTGRFALSINIDELDVLSVRKGQQAAITFDAIENQVFVGTIDRVAAAAIEAGGIAKYPARILIEADQRMRPGMSVTATITVDEKKDILLLPVTALQESGGRIFVYTAKDEKSGSLTGEVDLETGLSDGDRVEITGGLREGETVFYKVTTTDNLFPFSPPGHRTGRNSQAGEGTADE